MNVNKPAVTIDGLIAHKIGTLELDLMRRDFVLASLEVDMRRLKAAIEERDATIAALKSEVSCLRDAAMQPSLDLKHSSDCAQHNAPALEPKPCDCDPAHLNGGPH
jgi:hypothetical protein